MLTMYYANSRSHLIPSSQSAMIICLITRKLCYRKDNCAMRPIYGCPENFRDSLTTPTATFLKFFHGLLFRLILWICGQNLKFVALPFPEIIGGTQNGHSWLCPHSLFPWYFPENIFPNSGGKCLPAPPPTPMTEAEMLSSSHHLSHC